MSQTIFEERYACHPDDFKKYDTDRIRKEFLISDLFKTDKINLIYSLYDRYIVGSAFPVNEVLQLETFNSLKSDFFLERRELGIVNVGGQGIIIADGVEFQLGYKEALYLGMGTKEVTFASQGAGKPAKFYLNSSTAHQRFPSKLVKYEEADSVRLGSLETANDRKINKMLVHQNVDTCQLQMGMTELKPGSVWNTMPAHVHNRRMEAYFYFEVPADQSVCHFMGQPQETRHSWMQNEEAVLSPSWSIHSAAGTSNYIFVWGMAGENLDYGDMDHVKIPDLR